MRLFVTTAVGSSLISRRPSVPVLMSGERAADEGDPSGGPPGDRGVQLTELGFGDVQPAGGNRRSQFDEDRPQVDGWSLERSNEWLLAYVSAAILRSPSSGAT